MTINTRVSSGGWRVLSQAWRCRQSIVQIGAVLVMLCGFAASQTKPAAKPAPQSGSSVTNWKQIPIPPLHAFHPQQPKRIELSNGIVIFLQEDHELPLIGGTITIRGGGLDIPKAKTGMMGLYGQVWRLGGTEKLTGDQMDDYLESRAAHIGTSGGMTSTSLNWSSLKNDFNDVFAMAVDLLQHPAFREDKLTLLKTQTNGAIARRNDDVGSIEDREVSKVAYGEDNPYSWTPEYDTIAAVTRQDLVDFHKSHLSAANMMIGVIGDFDSASMERTLRQAFESWPRGERTAIHEPQFHDPKPAIYLADKNDVNQASIEMVHLGIQRNNPDLFAADVMDQAFFSGGFSSRFMEAIRTRLALAYDAGGQLSAPFDHPGIFAVNAATKSGTVAQAVAAMKRQIIDYKSHPITPEELKRAKDAILNNFIFRFDSKEKVLNERMVYEFWGYPADFLERYRAGVEKVTAEDVMRVYAKYVHPERLATVVVGNAAEFDEPLSTLGQVVNLDISIPPPGSLKDGAKPANAGGAAANTPEAKAVMAKAVQALGGEEKLKQVKAVRAVASATQKSPQGDQQAKIEQFIVYPDRLRMVQPGPGGADMAIVVSPNAGFAAMGEMSQDLPPSMRQELLKQIKFDELYIGQHSTDGTVNVTLAAPEKVGDADTQVLDIDSSGVHVRWFVDPASGRLLRSQHDEMGPSGPRQVTTDYSEWKPVDGVMFAFSEKQSSNGEDGSTIKVEDVQVNPAVDSKLFEKPGAPK